MQNLRAEDLLVPLDKYPHVPYWFTLRQAMAAMAAVQIESEQGKSLPRAILVFDEAYRLLGLARRRDILNGLEPTFLMQTIQHHPKKLFDIEVDANLSEVLSDKLLEHLERNAEKPISDVMRPIEVVVDADDHILKLIHDMVHFNKSIIPVQKDDRVIGVVRTVEVLHEIAKQIL